MSVAAFVSYLKGIQERIQVGAPAVAQTAAITGASLIVERIQREGFPGATYSKNRLPGWYFSGRELNAGGAEYLREQKESDQGVTWGEFRVANGLQADRVDGTFSGRTLGGIVGQPPTTTGFRHKSTMGGSDREVDQKLGWLAERYGDEAFSPTEDEQEEVREVIEDGLAALLKP